VLLLIIVNVYTNIDDIVFI